MSGRRRGTQLRLAAPTARRLAGAGASAAVAVLAVAPMAHADAKPRPATTDSATPGTDQSGTSGRTVQADPVEPNYGYQKVRVGVQLKDGNYYPDGTTTAGTKITITETGPRSEGIDPVTCTTDAATQEPGSTATYCTFNNDNLRAAKGAPAIPSDPIPFNQLYTLQYGDSATIEQTSVLPNMQQDTVTQTVKPCEIPVDTFPPVCADVATRVFTDPGLPPVAAHDSGRVKPGGSITVQVLGNDTTKGAAPTIKIIDKPAHGTATVVNQAQPAVRSARRAAGSPAILYRPDAGFFGHDSLRYSLTTANGTSTATVSLLVAARPTARDDSATTPAGHDVTIAVLANDLRNGGGALSVDSVGDPGHGTVAIRDGEVVYTPDDGFTGTDTFTYVARNSIGTDTATVTVTVTGVANTGTPSSELVGLAALLLATGGAASVAGRRRYRARHAGGA